MTIFLTVANKKSFLVIGKFIIIQPKLFNMNWDCQMTITILIDIILTAKCFLFNYINASNFCTCWQTLCCSQITKSPKQAFFQNPFFPYISIFQSKLFYPTLQLTKYFRTLHAFISKCTLFEWEAQGGYNCTILYQRFRHCSFI